MFGRLDQTSPKKPAFSGRDDASAGPKMIQFGEVWVGPLNVQIFILMHKKFATEHFYSFKGFLFKFSECLLDIY